jgi:hypothetical protein
MPRRSSADANSSPLPKASDSPNAGQLQQDRSPASASLGASRTRRFRNVHLGDTVSAYTSEIITFDRWTAELFIKGHLQEIESFLDAARKHQTRLHDLGLYNEPETP